MEKINLKIEECFNEYLGTLLTFLENKGVTDNEKLLMKKVFWTLHDKIQDKVKEYGYDNFGQR